MDLATGRKQIHGLGEQNCGCRGGGGGSGMDWESGVNRCKLLPLEWISNEILLYSPGNYEVVGSIPGLAQWVKYPALP